jgi:hypothetical protein
MILPTPILLIFSAIAAFSIRAKKTAEQRAMDRQRRDGRKRLACVKKADGDIEKLTRCATI